MCPHFFYTNILYTSISVVDNKQNCDSNENIILAAPKRKHDELDPQNGTKSKKKHHDPKENAEETNDDKHKESNAKRDETVMEGSEVVADKNAGDGGEKFSGLPEKCWCSARVDSPF